MSELTKVTSVNGELSGFVDEVARAGLEEKLDLTAYSGVSGDFVKHSELGEYATKEYVDDSYDAAIAVVTDVSAAADRKFQEKGDYITTATTADWDVQGYIGKDGIKVDNHEISLSAEIVTPAELDDYYKKSETYNKEEVDGFVDSIADTLADIAAASGDWNKVTDKLDTTAFNDVIADYYKKEETSAASELEDKFDEVDTSIEALETTVASFGSYEVVPSTASVSNPSTKIIYLVKDTSVTASDVYKEYIYVSAGQNPGFELIGDTSIDLTDYYTKDQTSAASELATAFDDLKDEIAGITADYVTKEEAEDWDTETYTGGNGIKVLDHVISVSGDYVEQSDLADNYYTKTESDEKFQPVGDYVTTAATANWDVEEYVGGEGIKVDNHEISVSGDYLTATALDNYYNKAEVDGYTAAISDTITAVSGEVDSKIASTTAWVDSNFQPTGDYVTSDELTAALDDYVTDSELSDMLDGYYTTAETSSNSQLDTKFTEVDDAITALENTVASFGSYEIVSTTASVTDPSSKVIYLVKDTSVTGSDVYKEYIYLSASDTFEMIGDTSIDLSNYYTKSQTSAASELTNKFNAIDGQISDIESDYIPTAASAGWDITEYTAGAGIGIENHVVSVTGDYVESSELSDYYKKDETSGKLELESAFNDIAGQISDIEDEYVATATTGNWDVTAYSGKDGIKVENHEISITAEYVVPETLDNYYDKTDIDTYSAAVAEQIGDVDDDVSVITAASADWNTVTAKLDTTAFSDVSGTFLTSEDLSNYYTKDETSGKLELDAAFDDKQDTLTFEYDENDAISAINSSAIAGQKLEAGIDLVIDGNIIKVNTDGAVANSADMSFVAGRGTSANGDGAMAVGTSAYIIDREYIDPSTGEWVAEHNNVYTVASGKGAVAFGMGSSALGDYSHAEGALAMATGPFSHAEGGARLYYEEYGGDIYYVTEAAGSAAHAEGFNTWAVGNASHTEGFVTEAHNDGTHAEGASTIAYGYAAHSEGHGTVASGDYSHSEGEGTIAGGFAMHVGGKYNATSSNALFVIGNGTAKNARSDAFIISENGYASATRLGTSGISDVESAITALQNTVANFGSYEVVNGTTTADITDPDTKTIYLIKNTSILSGDAYEEWICTNVSTPTFEMIGNTEIDLSDYVTSESLGTTLADYQPVSGMSAYQPSGDYVTTADNAELSSTVNTLTASSATWDTVINKLDESTYSAESANFVQTTALEGYISFNDLQFGVI